MEFVLLCFIGCLAGGVSSFLGVGGGILIVPLLPFVIQISQREVVALSLFTVFFIVLTNTIFFQFNKLVKWKVVFLLGFFSSVGAYFAGLLTASLNTLVLKGLLAGVLCGLALILFFPLPAFISSLEFQRSLSKKRFLRAKTMKLFSKRNVCGSFIGFLGGVTSGCTGVGVGSLFTSFSIYFAWLGKSNIVPTSHAITVFTSLFGALAFAGPLKEGGGMSFFSSASWGVIRLDLFWPLVLGALPSTVLGLMFQHLLSSVLRKKILATIILLVSLKALVSLIFMK